MKKTQVQLDNPEVQFPLIHINGNDGKTLGHQYWDALLALERFSEKFFAVQFHQRDYYPLGEQAWTDAVQQRDPIKEKIIEIRQYLSLHAQHCFESVREH